MELGFRDCCELEEQEIQERADCGKGEQEGRRCRHLGQGGKDAGRGGPAHLEGQAGWRCPRNIAI